MAALGGVLSQCDVLALQEVHVNAVALRLELATILGDWIVEMTAHVDAATGGTALLVRRTAFSQGAVHQAEVLHRGRALAVPMEKEGVDLTLVSVHIYGMNIAEANAFARRIPEMVTAAPTSWRS